jgi:hypothetical protein
LRAGDHLSEVQIVNRYHSCTFFCIPTERLIWR